MFGLENDILNKIYQILNKYKDNISWVKIFGSRAIGNYNLNSDIDIAICLKSNVYNILKEDMEESEIFYKIYATSEARRLFNSAYMAAKPCCSAFAL